jgi:hypothetical protein
LAAIMMNHMLAKNHDKDRWFSHLRMPYKRVFSKRNPRVRYRGASLKINLPHLCLQSASTSITYWCLIHPALFSHEGPVRPESAKIALRDRPIMYLAMY